MDETPFVETNALLHIMGDNEEEADRLVREDMMPHERVLLRHHLHQLAGVVYRVQREKGEVHD